ncbi:spore germination protein [Paenibacillus mucilaginosus]|nr:spore germination protein [Paenibacillus mucilaginosus]WFA22767.1 spore germination protein [Paenibacillus mucilaginosus]
MLFATLDDNIQVLRALYQKCDDVIFRSFSIGGGITRAELIYIEGLTDTIHLDKLVLEPLMQAAGIDSLEPQALLKEKVPVSKAKEISSFPAVIEEISNGNPLIFFDGSPHAFALGMARWEMRSIEEPTAESVIRGPREGFNESIGVNASLIRRKLKTPHLKMQAMKVGRYSQTQVMIAYIEGLADTTLIEEVQARIRRIDIDGVLESGYIEEMIEDNPFSPFPQVLATERPDTVSASLLEGRVAILVDGTPFVLVAPVSFYSLLQSAEDYYERYIVGTAIRWMRYAFLLVSLLMPSAYIAILTYHQEMIPTTLLLSVAKSREEIPFPALVEALLMEISFEALREAGVRLPKQVGAAVSIVGALVVGQAATSAGLVSAPMVMVVAITGIASITIPRYSAGIALRILRFPIMFLAGTLGLLGIMLGLITIIIHLCSLRSFGVPYLTPMAPMKFSDMKDVMLRAPFWAQNSRPHLSGEYDSLRQSYGNKPGPGKVGE